MKFFCLVCLAMVTTLASAADRYVYVNNQNQPNTITAFQVNANGSLTQLDGSPFITGGVGAEGPIESMAIVRFGPASYLYAANGGDGTISVFTIDRTTGNIQPIAGSPFATDGSSGTYDIAASPDRKFLFVSNEATTDIHVLAIAKTTGALSEISGSPFAVSANITSLYVTANNQFLLAAANSINAVEVFSIAASGAITQVSGSPFPGSGSVMAVQSNCANDMAFDVNNDSNYVDAYSLSSSGTLTPVPGSPFWNGVSGTGPNSFDLVLSPDDDFLFTTDSFTQDVTSFSVSPAGALSPVTGSPFYTSSWEGGTTITRNGDFVYSVQFASGKVDGRKVNHDGSLTAVRGTPFGPGNQNSLNGEVNSVISYPPPRCRGN
jgi:6-phosphogluconolactonase (cycloisomerase 2 family)